MTVTLTIPGALNMLMEELLPASTVPGGGSATLALPVLLPGGGCVTVSIIGNDGLFTVTDDAVGLFAANYCDSRCNYVAAATPIAEECGIDIGAGCLSIVGVSADQLVAAVTMVANASARSAWEAVRVAKQGDAP